LEKLNQTESKNRAKTEPNRKTKPKPSQTGFGFINFSVWLQTKVKRIEIKDIRVNTSFGNAYTFWLQSDALKILREKMKFLKCFLNSLTQINFFIL
jgi:hypothetical protein